MTVNSIAIIGIAINIGQYQQKVRKSCNDIL